MKLNYLLPIILTVCTLSARAIDITPAFTDDHYQFTGVALSKSGRMFVNYPRWQQPHRFDVVEVMSNNIVRPFPNEIWNSWNKGSSGTNKWVCVQAVYVDDTDTLWVVDPAAPEMKKVQGEGTKLVSINLSGDQVSRIYPLTAVAGNNSYLNDVRVDTRTQTAYLTESKNGGIIVINLESGDARLLLSNHPSVKADPNHKLIVDGEELKRNGKPFKGNSDGIALSPDRQWLYYKSLSDTRLFRIPTEDLRNSTLSEKELGKKVQDLGASFSTSDGLIFDQQGNLFFSDQEHNSIARLTPAMKFETIVHDPKLIWPDTFTWSSDGLLYVTCSQIQTMAWSHDGKSTRTTPYTIYKIKMK